MSDSPTLICPECGNTSPAQPLGTPFCHNYEAHFRNLRRWVAIEMKEEAE